MPENATIVVGSSRVANSMGSSNTWTGGMADSLRVNMVSISSSPMSGDGLSMNSIPNMDHVGFTTSAIGNTSTS